MFIVVPRLDSVNYIFNMSSFVIIADVSEIFLLRVGVLSSIVFADLESKRLRTTDVETLKCFVYRMIIEVVLFYYFDFF